MKTPMQELITAIRMKKYSEINEQAWEAYDYVIDIAKSMLNKEKEVIENAYWDGGQWVPTSGSQCEEYYNETFNTK